MNRTAFRCVLVTPALALQADTVEALLGRTRDRLIADKWFAESFNTTDAEPAKVYGICAKNALMAHAVALGGPASLAELLAAAARSVRVANAAFKFRTWVATDAMCSSTRLHYGANRHSHFAVCLVLCSDRST
jgi:hypothetical protein